MSEVTSDAVSQRNVPPSYVVALLGLKSDYEKKKEKVDLQLDEANNKLIHHRQTANREPDLEDRASSLNGDQVLQVRVDKLQKEKICIVNVLKTLNSPNFGQCFKCTKCQAPSEKSRPCDCGGYVKSEFLQENLCLHKCPTCTNLSCFYRESTVNNNRNKHKNTPSKTRR